MPDPLPTETKPWYQSVTIIAASVVAFLQVVPDILNTVNAAMPDLHLATNPIVMKVLSIIGIIVAIYGRFTAKTIVK